MKLNHIFNYIAVICCAAAYASAPGATTVTLPPPPSVSAALPAQSASPNQVLADLAKEVLLKSLKPEYQKQENWGHQKEIAAGYAWVQKSDGWHFEKQTRKANDGLWREYSVRFENPQKNLQLRFTPPAPAEDGKTAFVATINARLNVEARQEQWYSGVKGLNFQVAGEAQVEAKLALVIGIHPAPDKGFGSIEINPVVTHVGLRLVDLNMKKVDFLHGDAAKELGHAFEDILAGELRKQEPKAMEKINAEIAKHRDKLQFSPAQIAELGWDKVQALLGATSAASGGAK